MMPISAYYKAVVAGVGSVVTGATAIVPLLALVHGTWAPVADGASILIAVAAVANPLYVFLVRNEPLVEDISTAVASARPVVTAVKHAVEAVEHPTAPGV